MILLLLGGALTVVLAYVIQMMLLGQRKKPPNAGGKPIPDGPPIRAFCNEDVMIPDTHKAGQRLVDNYGHIFWFMHPRMKEGPVIWCSDPKLLEQVLPQPEVWPKLHMKVTPVRKRVGDGLFTSDDDEEIWGIAHRILLPAFSPQGMKHYFDIVREATEELFTGMSRRPGPVELHVWLAKYTFEVICRVAFGINYNSLLTDSQPPFTAHLHKFMELSWWARTSSTGEKLLVGKQKAKEMQEARDHLWEICGSILREKKAALQADPKLAEKKDLVTLMLTTKDPRTGKMLPDQNMISQTLTFLIAGHDSTSTAITMLLYHVAQEPRVQRKLKEEVDRVLGRKGSMTWKKFNELEYCGKALKENLRMCPPASQFIKTAGEDTMLGEYGVRKGTRMVVSTFMTHHNAEHWPEPYEFRPERFDEEAVAARSPCAWIPFSQGPRSCIGQQLSLIEQRMVLGLMTQRFDYCLHGKTRLEVTEPLFLSTEGIFLRIVPRVHDVPRAVGAADEDDDEEEDEEEDEEDVPKSAQGQELTLLYGSNMGTSQELVGQLQARTKLMGFNSSVYSLDEACDKRIVLPAADKGAVIIIASTYNGCPPDNALKFAKLCGIGCEQDEEKRQFALTVFKKVQYAVFGCGNAQWANTFMQFPRAVDEVLSAAGAKRFCPMGEGDAAQDIDDAFASWTQKMYPALHQSLGLAYTASTGPAKLPLIRIEPAEKWDIDEVMRVVDSYGLDFCRILKNDELQDTSKSGRSTRNVEISLPPMRSYEAGDHLGVVGKNHDDVVALAAKLLKLDLDQAVVMKRPKSAAAQANNTRDVPFGLPLPVSFVLGFGMDLQALASQNLMGYLAGKAAKAKGVPDYQQQADELKALAGDAARFDREVRKMKKPLLELLQEFPAAAVDLTLAELLALCPPLKPRFYSISSSSKAFPASVHVCIGVVEGASPTGRIHHGACSTFIAQKKVGDNVRCFVKDTKSTFRLPEDPSTPIIMIGPGTGFAPMRGFIQERVQQQAAGKNVLYFGCRDDYDYIFRSELEAWEKDGALKLRVAFSRKQQAKVYVQNLIQQDSAEVWQLLEQGAHIYVCGDASRMAVDVRKALNNIIVEHAGCSSAEADARLEQLVKDRRYCQDVWASS